MSRSRACPLPAPIIPAQLSAALLALGLFVLPTPESKAVMFVLDDFTGESISYTAPNDGNPDSFADTRPPSGTDLDVAYVGDMSLAFSTNEAAEQTTSISGGSFSFGLTTGSDDSVTLGYGSAVTGSSFEMPQGVTNVRLDSVAQVIGSYNIDVAFLDDAGDPLGSALNFLITGSVPSIFADFGTAGIADPDDIGGFTLTFTPVDPGTGGVVAGSVGDVLLTPEPSRAVLLAAGLWGLLFVRRRR